MKVNNFNGNFLPNKQNKEQKSNLQNKAVMQNSVNFKGSAANDSLSAMGQAQVNMNKSKNIAFKGYGPVPNLILANVREGKRPEQLRACADIFENKIVQHWESEKDFDKTVTNFMLDENKRLDMDNVNKIFNLTYNKSRMNRTKFDDHVLPKTNDYTQYYETHPIHSHKIRTLHDQLVEKNITNATAGAAAFGTMVAATGGLALLLSGVALDAAAARSIHNANQMDREKAFYRNNTVVPDLYSKSFDYKLKNMITRGKIEAGEAASVVRHYR